MIYNSFSDLVGNTPLFKCNNYSKNNNLKANLYTKLEYLNPAGSCKDRVALNMILDYEKRGLLKPGSTIIEPTSGNTGIGLAAVCTSKGYKAIIIMPDSMSKERILLMKAYGAELYLTPGSLGMKGCIDKALELQKQIPGSMIAGQFDNPANPQAHYLTTGPEIYNDLDGNVDIFVAGIGTGGTISGVAKYLKEKNPSCRIVGIEPFDSPLITKGVAGPHKLQGIGANFIPSNLDLKLIDEIIAVTTDEAYKTTREFAKYEGILVGVSSGAALYAATVLSQKKENEGKNIVVLLPDTGDRYLSTPDLFE